MALTKFKRPKEVIANGIYMYCTWKGVFNYQQINGFKINAEISEYRNCLRNERKADYV